MLQQQTIGLIVTWTWLLAGMERYKYCYKFGSGKEIKLCAFPERFAHFV